MNEEFLKEKLATRQKSGNLRSLPVDRGLVDFVSNDYLGLSRNQALAERIERRVKEEGFIGNGGTGSRLLSGNHPYYAQLEDFLSEIFQAEATLVFNSGYAANQALVAAVAEKGDTILYDILSHVCLKEGAWLSSAQTVAFRHNDLEDLEMKLQQSSGRVFVVTESIFSMDGDIAPLEEILTLCEKYAAYLIVDEAHSTGVYGEAGAGLVVSKNLHDRIFARVYTFGKAMGVHGACVAGSQVLKDFLVNFGRPFIYTTSLPAHSIISIGEAFAFLKEKIDLQIQLEQKITTFRAHFFQSLSYTAIQPVMIGSNEKARAISSQLQNEGFDVRPILSPTVQRGTERLRISLHVHNQDHEIVSLASTLTELLGI
jgi:8-amino-7-oxononanoate synthase